ncbi:hypothetical protein BD770DRAFT_405423 [Pilaira anomala]|nr:hypothetical protein BD770DRAFT_405423 [Pilaira anomala]
MLHAMFYVVNKDHFTVYTTRHYVHFKLISYLFNFSIFQRYTFHNSLSVAYLILFYNYIEHKD